MGLNYVHEATHSVYIKHVYNGTVADTFLGDEVFGEDRTIPIEYRVDDVVKRVQKFTTSAKPTVGQTDRGGHSAIKRGGAGRRGGSNSNGAGRTTSGRITTATTTGLISTMAYPTKEPATYMETTAMADTTDRVLVSFMAQLGIMPSSALKPKHHCFFIPGK